MTLPISLSPGDQVYKFTLKNRIGSGSFGEVWLVHDQTIKSDFAVKFLDASRVSIGNLLKEAEVGYRTGHGNLATVHFADVIDHAGIDLVAVSMDYYRSGSTVNQVCAGGFVPIREAVSQVIDILRGLEYLHEQNTLHNDIKPQNILVGSNGEGILTDYGIAEVANSKTGAKPKAAYRLHKAPEVIQKSQINVVTDIYQVGMTALRLINGIELVRSKLTALGRQEFQNRVVVGKLITSSDYRPFVPSAVRRVINKATQHEPLQRYQSALEMRRALEKLHLTGSWIITASGDYFGEDADNEYRFETEAAKKAGFNFTAYKKRKRSGRETRISKCCGSGITEQETKKLQSKFMRGVVEGTL